MNFNAVLVFILFQQCLMVSDQECIQSPTVTAQCNATEEAILTCADSWQPLKRASSKSCYALGTRMPFLRAETFCSSQHSHLPLLSVDSKEDMKVWREILDLFNIHMFWLTSAHLRTVSEQKHRPCQFFLDDQIQSVKCHKELSVVCVREMSAAYDKPVLHIGGYGDLAQKNLFTGTPVVVTCSVIRGSFRNLFIRIRHSSRTQAARSGSDLVTVTEETKCGVKTISSLTVLAKHQRKISALCYFESSRLENCSAENVNCVESDEFYFTPAPSRPRIRLPIDEPPNVVYEYEDLRAGCTAQLNRGCNFSWAVTMNQEILFLNDGDFGVKIEAETTRLGKDRSRLTLVLKGRGWAYKEIGLTCYSVQDWWRSCKPGDYWCWSITLHIKPRPKLKVYYDRPPDVMFKGHTLEARCLIDVGKRGRILWAGFKKFQLSSGQQIEVSPDTEEARGATDFVQIKEMPHLQRYNLSILHIRRISAINNNIIIACIPSYIGRPSTERCQKLKKYCALSHSIKIIGGPEPPAMSVFFNSQPSYLLVGNDLTAECNAVIGENGTLMWVLYINSTVITDNDKDLNITMSHSINTFKKSFNRRLKITKVSHTLNGLVIACFSYDIRMFPRRRMRCVQEDPLCKATVPLRLNYSHEWTFAFGQDKILKYVLMWLVWLSLVVVVHLYVWYGPCICYPTDAEPFTNDDKDFDDHMTEDKPSLKKPYFVD